MIENFVHCFHMWTSAVSRDACLQENLCERQQKETEKYFTKGIRMCSVLADVLWTNNIKSIVTNLNEHMVFNGYQMLCLFITLQISIFLWSLREVLTFPRRVRETRVFKELAGV